ncbi:Xaa-Pro peptidase family protein [Ectobacillus sp. JY-23]|uniref:M24 family metallopeptidase n=1 Tax=Ectobacillus sp. JY-23 TaxID=2933872 RepID=UPI001FF2366B|nr:Xaa-Pro peptidase family protein [Ectobacillus sp. JY-23]UOY94294.1 Xaa-Pro peptidase family protein [Ectobacillus sp. JY-23]
MEHRLHNLMSWLQKQDIEAAFITSTSNVFYLTGFHCEPHERLLGVFVFPEKEPILICPKMEEGPARSAGWPHEIIGFSDTDNPWVLIEQAMQKRDISVRTIAVEKEHLNVERYEELLALFSGAAFVAAEAKLHELRLIKDEKELAILRQAAYMADWAVELGVSQIAEGKSEMEILGTIEYELKKKGISKMSFDTMVLAGANSALPHGEPGTNQIKRGDFVLFDLGVVIDGYCSDITRTVAFGDISEEQRNIYETVLTAQLQAIEASKPGAAIDTVDRAARSYIENAGYGAYFPHRLGHGLGISVHEYPSLTDANTSPLRTGMVFTIEPGIYVPNVGGVRIEDDIYVTTDGVEILTKYPKELHIIK